MIYKVISIINDCTFRDCISDRYKTPAITEKTKAIIYNSFKMLFIPGSLKKVFQVKKILFEDFAVSIVLVSLL